MKFGPVPLAEAEGAILAHSVGAGGRKYRKGTVLSAEDLAGLAAGGITEVTVARPGPEDAGENEAAARIAGALITGGAGLRVTEAHTGRANLVAASAGVLRLDPGVVLALNGIDPGITLATLPDLTRVAEGMLVATVKIIPYAVPRAALDRALAALGPAMLRIAPPVIASADLVMTRTEGLSEKLLAKGERVVRDRLAALGVRLERVETVGHETGAVAAALGRSRAPLVLVLGASATSDAADVCPAGLREAGGALTRFGMPVDPGNLLFIGSLGARAVIGLPGCARSPALNGADWVLERVVCGIAVESADIAAMGVGGLLKEIPLRPQPRAIGAPKPRPPVVEIVLLAAGASRRMGGRDKLLEEIDGQPLLQRSAAAALASGAAEVHLVLPPGSPERSAAVAGLGLDRVTALQAAEGMGASLRAGMAAVSDEADAVIIALADMPDVSGAHLDRLIAAFDPEQGHEICRSVSEAGAPGHPVLFGRRFFENLADLGGDVGARDVLRGAPEFVIDVPTEGEAAVTDLDTPAHWAAYRARGKG